MYIFCSYVKATLLGSILLNGYQDNIIVGHVLYTLEAV